MIINKKRSTNSKPVMKKEDQSILRLRKIWGRKVDKIDTMKAIYSVSDKNNIITKYIFSYFNYDNCNNDWEKYYVKRIFRKSKSNK